MNKRLYPQVEGVPQSAPRRLVLLRIAIQCAGTAFGLYITQFLAAPIQAQSQVPGVFNTGVDDSGAILANYSVDPHYTLISNAGQRCLGVKPRVKPRRWQEKMTLSLTGPDRRSETRRMKKEIILRESGAILQCSHTDTHPAFFQWAH